MSTATSAQSAGGRRATGRTAAARARRAFLGHFPGGFHDPTYLEWERGYKWAAHRRWIEELRPDRFRQLLRDGENLRIARSAIAIESRTNLLFSFEKMALRDAVKTTEGARVFATSLFEMLHGRGTTANRFDRWQAAVGQLPRRQTRVLTWPILTVFPFIAQPSIHLYLKPTVTRVAADAYGYPFEYRSVPNSDTYEALLGFGKVIRRDLRDLRPRDQIDVQSFIWVIGSDEYS